MTDNNQSSSTDKTFFNGLSVALYVGSLLIIAGVAGLVLSGAKELGLVLLFVMTVAFYGGGVLLRNNQTLKIASYVFAGTGMIMLPFIGLLIYDITKTDPTIIWLTVSLIGIPMYLFAAYIMNSRVFAYFAILGLISFCCSLASVMSLALVWYFALVMLLGIIIDLLNLTGFNKRLGAIQPSFQAAGEWLPLVTLITSFFAFSSLTTLDYVIVLSIALIQLVIDYILQPAIAREILLRIGLGAWVLLIIYLFNPGTKIMGMALAGVTLLELLFTFFRSFGDLSQKDGRKECEMGWIILCMVAFIVAGTMIGDGNEIAISAWCSFALAVDSILLCIARIIFRDDIWYCGLVLTGIALPMTVTSALNVSLPDVLPFLSIIYILEMMVMTFLFWRNQEKLGNALTITSAAVLGLAAALAGTSSDMFTALALFVFAAILWLRGNLTKQETIKESSIYSATASICFLVLYFNRALQLNINGNVLVTILVHIVLAGLIVSHLLWERKAPPFPRLIAGSSILLAFVGGTALFGINWAMYLFLVETVGILLSGVFLKDQVIRIIGLIGVFLAVLWFTKDWSFMWPILLGFSVIGIVIFVLIRNSHKNNTPPKLS